MDRPHFDLMRIKLDLNKISCTSGSVDPSCTQRATVTWTACPSPSVGVRGGVARLFGGGWWFRAFVRGRLRLNLDLTKTLYDATPQGAFVRNTNVSDDIRCRRGCGAGRLFFFPLKQLQSEHGVHPARLRHDLPPPLRRRRFHALPHVLVDDHDVRVMATP